MITLEGTYADGCNGPIPDASLRYVCRVFLSSDGFFDGVGNPVEVNDGDVLMLLGRGTWFALYQPRSAIEALPDPEPDPAISIDVPDPGVPDPEHPKFARFTQSRVPDDTWVWVWSVDDRQYLKVMEWYAAQHCGSLAYYRPPYQPVTTILGGIL